MKDEFYSLAFRKRVYNTLEELQSDVDKWLKQYNELRPHSGRYCYGKTPMQTFLDSKHVAQEKNYATITISPETSDSVIYLTDVVR